MSRVTCGIAVALLLAGCGGRKSSLLLERPQRGPLAESPTVAKGIAWNLGPVTQTLEQRKIEVSVTYASQEFLQEMFSNREVFGNFAGPNPYFLENLVFYVKIANKSERRIAIAPVEFALVDDRGNQYATINEDYVKALAEARTPVATATRGVVEEARPGYFGFNLPIGKMVATRPIARFARIKLSSLQQGYLHPEVVHDGLIAFWSPSQEATSLKLLITSIKTDYDAEDLPQTSLEFPFTFQVLNQHQQAATP